MFTKFVFVLFAFVSLISCMSDNNSGKGDLFIIDHSPETENQFKDSAIKVTFNKKMTVLGKNRDITNFIQIEPKVDCDSKWINETTLKCTPRKELKIETAYNVVVKKGLKDLDGSKLKFDYKFKFFHIRPRLKGIVTKGYNLKEPLVELHFIHPVDFVPTKSEIVCDDRKYLLNQSDVKPDLIHLKLSDAKAFKSQNDTLASCDLFIEGMAKGKSGELETNVTVSNKLFSFSDEKIIDSELVNSDISGSLSRLQCLNGYWYSESLNDVKYCNVGGPITLFPFYTSTISSVQITPQPKNFKTIENPSSTIIDGDFVAGVDYLVKFKTSNDKSEKNDNRFVVTFLNKGAQALYQRKFSVIEKTGPLKVPFETVNIKSAKFTFENYSTFDDLSKYIQGRSAYSTENTREKVIRFTVDPITNEAIKIPISLSDIFPNKAGVFRIRSSDFEIDPTIINHTDLIKKNSSSRWLKFTKPGSSYTRDVLVTDIGIHFKKGFMNSAVWVFDIPTGNPIEGAQVHLLGRKDNDIFITDKDGFALIDRTVHENEVVVTYKDDISYLKLGNSWSNPWQKGIRPYSFNVDFKGMSSYYNIVAETITDSPIYRPGSIVKFKSFFRKWSLKNLVFVKSKIGKEVKVLVRDPRGSVVFRDKLILSEFSSINSEFRLEKNAKLGDYQISVTCHDCASVWTKGFKVEEFELSPYKVRADAKSGYVNVNADYYFGGPVKEAHGVMSAKFIARPYTNSKFKNFVFHDHNFRSSNIRPVTNDFVTDDKGTAKIELPNIHNYNQFIKGSYNVNVEVSSDTGKAVGASTSYDLISSGKILGAKTINWTSKKGKSIRFKTVLLSPKGDFVTGHKITAKLKRKYWSTTRRLGSGNYFYYDSSEEIEEVESCEFISSKSFESCDLRPKSSGYHMLELTHTDEKTHRTIKVVLTQYVTGSDYISWGRYNHDRIDIVPDKSQYSLGENARFIIKSPYDKGKMLITVERYGIIHKEIVDIKGNLFSYSLPLKDSSYAPGVYVSAVLVKGRTSDKIEGNVDLGKPSFKIGYSSIRVKDTELKLLSNISIEKNKYTPGEEVSGTIEIIDPKRESKEFEVAVAVVDEAVLDVYGNYKSRYDLFDTFYKMPKLSVENYQTLINLAGRQTYGKKGGNPGGGGASSFEHDIRSNFLLTAYWNPSMKTKDGKVNFKFKAPDNLTTWKVIVISNDKTRKFGYGDKSLLVSKDLILEPQLPVFLTQGDVAKSSLVVHNKTKKDVTVGVYTKTPVDKSYLSIDESKEKNVVSANSKKAFQVDLKALKKGRFNLELGAKSKNLFDALMYELEVIPLQTKIVDGFSGTLVKDSTSIPYELPSSVIKDTSFLSLKLSSTILGNLDKSLSYNLSYPYGCWEQRLSKVLALANYKQFKDQIVLDNKINFDIDEAINDFIALTPKYMSPEGAMRYYPGEHSKRSLYLSWFTIESFDYLREKGYKIDEQYFKKIINYLLNTIKLKKYPRYYISNHMNDMLAKIAYVSAKHNVSQSNLIDVAYKNLGSMSLFGKSYLLKALFVSGSKYKDKIENLKNNIFSQYEENNHLGWFKIDKSKLRSYFSDTSLRTVCSVVSGLIDTSSENDVRIIKLVKYIMEGRRNGRWYNTQENTFCSTAITKYAKRYESVEPDYEIVASISGKEILSEKLNLKKTNAKKMVPISLELKKSNIDISRKGKGRLYYSGALSYYINELPKKRTNQGIGLEKIIYKFNNSTKAWEKLLGQKLKLKIGDILRIRHVVSPESPSNYHVGVNDPLAGCFTVVNESLGNVGNAALAFSVDIPDSADGGVTFYRQKDFNEYSSFEYMDIRKTAVQFYASELGNTKYGLEYDVRVSSLGKFTMNAASAEQMYYPDVRGVSLGREITVEK